MIDARQQREARLVAVPPLSRIVIGVSRNEMPIERLARAAVEAAARDDRRVYRVAVLRARRGHAPPAAANDVRLRLAQQPARVAASNTTPWRNRGIGRLPFVFIALDFSLPSIRACRANADRPNARGAPRPMCARANARRRRRDYAKAGVNAARPRARRRRTPDRQARAAARAGRRSGRSPPRRAAPASAAPSPATRPPVLRRAPRFAA